MSLHFADKSATFRSGKCLEQKTRRTLVPAVRRPKYGKLRAAEDIFFLLFKSRRGENCAVNS